MLRLCDSCLASCCFSPARLLLGQGGWWRVSRIPLCGIGRTRVQRGGEGRGGWWAGASQQGGPSLAQLPGSEPEEGSACPSPFSPHPPPRAPWLLNLPAGPMPSQTTARRRGRSISEQRGPCGLRWSRIPLSHGQV